MRFQPLFSHAHKGRLSELSNANDVDRFFAEILHTTDEFVLMQSKIHRGYPRFQKAKKISHLAFKETRYINMVPRLLQVSPAVKVVGILRNPLATLASWYSAPREFSATWSLENEWRSAPRKNCGLSSEFYGFEKWIEVATLFLELENKYPNSFKLIRYGELRSNPEFIANQIFQFCELSFDNNTGAYIRESQSSNNDDSYSLSRSKKSDDQWKLILPDSIKSAIFKELANGPLVSFLEE